MKKCILYFGIMFCLIQQMIGQSSMTKGENFDGSSISFTASPASSWKVNKNYYLSYPNSYLGMVPNAVGDSTILTTPPYDFHSVSYTNVLLRFNHICKISSKDTVRIEYKWGLNGWAPIPATYYLGKATNYATKGFNTTSYPEWNTGDSLTLPSQSWWKEELFDVGFLVGGESNVQFRFVIKRGKTPGTQISYGWLLDNFEIVAATYDVTPPIVELISPFVQDTVSSTGPYTINARVKTSTQAAIQTPWLKYTYTYNGQTTTDSSLMTRVVGDSLWRGTIPQFPIGSSVLYSITGKDATGNNATVRAAYTIVPSTAVLITNYVHLSPNDTVSGSGFAASIFRTNQATSWSRTLCFNTELGNTNMSTIIAKLAWYNRSSNYTYTRKIRIYMQATAMTANNQATYINPVTNGAILVYDGTVTTKMQWNEVTLSTPFTLQAGENLLIFFEDYTGASSGSNAVNWTMRSGTANTGRLVHGYGSNISTSDAPGVMRFGMNNGTSYDSVSVALTDINSPNQDAIAGGQTTPIIVTFRNKGDSILHSVDIHWQVNSQTPQMKTWNATALLPDFEYTDTLGNYTPKVSGYDTIIVWVSNPNGRIDPITFDDRLTFISYGCPGQRSGTYTVGKNGATFKTISEAISVLKLCNPTGDVSLALDTGIYVENINLSNIQEYMGSHILTITSLRNDKNKTIIRPASGVGITIANSNNIILENITVDVAHLTAYAIQFTAVACTNIVINNCNIFTNLTGSSSSASGGIYKASGGLVDNIRFTNNNITGGRYGIYFYAGTGNNVVGTNIVIDSNEISEQSEHGMYLFYGKFNSVSNNTIYSRSANIGSTWYGIRTSVTNGNILNNRIIQRSNSIATSYGIHCSSLNWYSTVDTALIANNEVIIYGTNANTTGLYLYSIRAFVMQNSIYVSGTDAIRGVYTNDHVSNIVHLKNNNITTASGYPVYIIKATNLANYIFEANNYYAPAFVGFIGAPVATYSGWKQIIRDTLSIQVKPGFVNSATSLKLTDYTAFECKSLAKVPQDIDGNNRNSWTSMGCYHGLLSYNANASLKATALKEGSILNQRDSVKVLLINTGNTPITDAVINWSFNNTSTQKTWSGQLAAGDQTIVTLGEILYQPAGEYTLEASIANLGSLQDGNPDDDTVKVSGYICSGTFTDTITIGNASGNDFKTIGDALHAIELCGTGRDITLSLSTGTYEGNVDLLRIAAAMGNNNLVITSSSGNTSDVTLKTNSTGIVLANNKNVTIKNITIDATQGYSAVLFIDTCSNIEISNCILLGDTIVAANTNNPISKPEGTKIVNDIRVKNNIINGGYYGILFYDGVAIPNTSPQDYNLGLGITIEDNIIKNQRVSGIQAYQTNFKSISGNTIYSRTANTQTAWSGMSLNLCNANITGNRVIQQTNAITQPQGIYTTSLNRYKASSFATIANNEIKLYTTGGYCGIYMNFARANIYHNSIYIDGTGESRGIYISSEENEQMTIKNNNIVVRSTNGQPIYITSANYLNQYNIDYNNIYAPNSIGYAGSPKTTWEQWKASIPTDIHSIDSLPHYIDVNVNLKLSDYTGFECNIIPGIDMDIEKNIRIGQTTLGCYHGLSSPYAANGRLEEITGLQEGMTSGAKDSVKVVFVNAGITLLDTATLYWSLNNGSYQTVTWSGSLQNSESAIITLGEITYAPGINTISVYIKDLGLTTDNYPQDDTIAASVYVCPQQGMNGTYIVGKTGLFTDILTAFNQMNKCGVDGNITLELEPGTFFGSLDLSNLPSLMGNNNVLTITSTTGNHQDVIFKSIGNAITLSNSNNLVIDGITIDVTGGQRAIDFTSACTNVVVRNCRILGNPTSDQYTMNFLINKQYNLTPLQNVKIVNNLIDGHYTGIFFPGDNQDNLEEYITIDSNTFTNQSTLAIDIANSKFTSISHNVIESRISGSSSNWGGINASYVNGNIQANRIIQHDNSINNPSGIRISDFNSYNGLDSVFMANNEIMMIGNARPIYINNSKRAKVINNSLYVSGNSNAIGIEFASTQDNMVTVKNNNIAMLSSSAYPIYINSASNISQYNMDYNNMYAPAYVGYVGGDITSIAQWQQEVATDRHSVSIYPDYADINNDLTLLDSTNLSCPVVPGVYEDITGMQRSSVTTMGAYNYIDEQNDVTPLYFVDLNITYPAKDSVEVKIAIQNTGSNTLTTARISWTVNGTELVSPYTWSGSLAFGKIDTVAVGKFELKQGQTEIKLFTSLPNNSIDPKTKYDTLTSVIFACDSMLNGTYTVGTGKNINDIETALGMLQYCGINGDVTFLLADETHTLKSEITSYNGINAPNRITFTSETGNAANVIVVSPNTTVMTLNNVEHITIKDITLDGSGNGKNVTLSLVGNCTDVEINGCTILGYPDGLAANSRAIEYDNKPNSGKKLDNIRILNNKIDGGAYNVYFNYPGTGPGAMSGDIIINNNTLTNAYGAALYLINYGYYRSISNNIITTRGTSVTYQQYGMNLSDYSTVDTVSGNKINMKGYGNVRGLRFANSVNTTGPLYKANRGAFVINNEITALSNNTGNTFGIEISSTNIDLYHNSIYVAGTVEARGIDLGNDTTGYRSTIKNNMLVTATTAEKGYPLYVSHNYWASKLATDLDYNNYYSTGNYIAYTGGNRENLNELQTATGQDAHSVNIKPEFIDVNTSLEMEDTSIVLCPVNPLVTYDINNIPRIRYTNIGAYGLPTLDLDVALTQITFNPLNFIDQVSTPVLTIKNMGITNIDSVLINYSYNNIPQAVKSYTVSPLAFLAEANVNLDTIRPEPGMNHIKVWISKVNEAIADSSQLNDTLTFDFYGCDEALNGMYTVGLTGAYFKTVEDFITKVNGCGVDGPVTLAFKNGDHTGNLDLASVVSAFGTFPLTITSENSDTSLVRFMATSGAAITLGGNQNITIKDITINAIQANYAIQFIGACTNVVIDRCAILANPATTNSGNIVIYKGEKTGVLDNIQIRNNHIDGGYCGLWLYGGIDNSLYAANVLLDSNIFSNQSRYGIYAYYTDFDAISHNTILSRASNIISNWSGIQLYYSNGNITGNRIKQQSNSITASSGIDLSYYNYYNGNPNALISNNEIILNNTLDAYYGIYVKSSKATIVYNSIRIGGNTASKGIRIDGNDVDLTIRNNNLVTMSSNAYPLYIEQASVLNQVDLNYNNYYAPQYIGYAGENVSSLNTWKQIVTTDQKSVRIQPNFVDVTANLELIDYTRILAPLYANIDKDINGITREALTAMGAYTQPIPTTDLTLNSIVNLKPQIVNNESVAIEVEAMNVGNTTINEVTFGWSINGGTAQTSQWTASSSLQLFDIDTIAIDFFKASGASTFDIKVWIETVNNAQSAITINDTVSASVSTTGIVRFVDPLVADTINTLSFDVYAEIREGTGATIHTPKMSIKTIIQDTVFYDTLDMTHYQDMVWNVSTPQQYYGSKVIYSLHIADTVGNDVTITDSTYLKFAPNSEVYAGYNLGILSIEKLVPDSMLCSPDYTSVNVELANTGTNDYDFAVNNVSLSLRVTSPELFTLDTILSSGTLLSGESSIIELTDMFPIMVAGTYDIKVWIDSPLDNIIYDDTLISYYISGRFELPIDEDFSNGLPIEFNTKTSNPPYNWKVISQGTGADTVVKPTYGTGMLAFTGTAGTWATLSTRQLDLSRTIDPLLTFWYFHDTVECDDDMDVQITVDGGATYTKLFSLTKYDPTYYGWKEYSEYLPSYALGQCVVLVFEAMERSRSNDVTQYIDRITVTSSQNLRLDTLLISDVSVCSLTGHELNLVLENSTRQKIDFTTNPMELHLDITGVVNNKIIYPLSGTMEGLQIDTIPIVKNFDFSTKGDYHFKAYISSLAGDFNRLDDTTTNNISINPKLDMRIIPTSNGSNCAIAGTKIYQDIVVKNNGNMDLSNVGLILVVDAPEANPPYSEILMDTITMIAPGDSIRYTFTDFYTVPWSPTYQIQAFSYLVCDSALANAQGAVPECVETDDLALISIDKPSGQADTVGTNINIEVTLENKSDVTSFSGVRIHAQIEDSKGNIKADISETIPGTIAPLSPGHHVFNTPYTVPNDSVYYITVFIEKQTKDNYQQDDTLKITRTTNYKVGIESIEPAKISMSQNFPNPANNSTMINYSIPESGEVIFRIYSINGQLLYNKSVQSESGTNSIEINTSSLSAGIYVYSMEFKGQRITKRMSIKR